jgi:hypothetical protein
MLDAWLKDGQLRIYKEKDGNRVPKEFVAAA